MSAFCLFDVTAITDEGKMAQYREGVFATVHKHGGNYRVIGGPQLQVEGSWQPTFPVLIEFPSMEAARGWYDSEDYRELKAIRLEATTGHAVFFEGVAAGQ